MIFEIIKILLDSDILLIVIPLIFIFIGVWIIDFYYKRDEFKIDPNLIGEKGMSEKNSNKWVKRKIKEDKKYNRELKRATKGGK